MGDPACSLGVSRTTRQSTELPSQGEIFLFFKCDFFFDPYVITKSAFKFFKIYEDFLVIKLSQWFKSLETSWDLSYCPEYRPYLSMSGYASNVYFTTGVCGILCMFVKSSLLTEFFKSAMSLYPFSMKSKKASWNLLLWLLTYLFFHVVLASSALCIMLLSTYKFNFMSS